MERYLAPHIDEKGECKGVREKEIRQMENGIKGRGKSATGEKMVK